MNFRALVSAVLLTSSFVPVIASAQGAPADPWYRRSPRPRDFQVAKLPWNTFSIEVPRDWQMVPSLGGILLSLSEKTKNNQSGGAILLEHMQLQDSLTAKDIDAAVAQYEVTNAKQRDPGGENFAQQVKDVDGQRFIFIEYSRKGLVGNDKVILYEIPTGRILYRLICIAPADQIDKYQSTFAHVAASFKLTPPAGAN